MRLKHRNSQKRIYFEDAEYFVTCKTQGNYPFFEEKIFCDLFVENLRLCKELKGFVLYAWVLVWDHFHLLVRPSDEFDISDVMHNLKRVTSLQINHVIEGADIYAIKMILITIGITLKTTHINTNYPIIGNMFLQIQNMVI
jgi:REP element-mobilizing transposase RayT